MSPSPSFPVPKSQVPDTGVRMSTSQFYTERLEFSLFQNVYMQNVLEIGVLILSYSIKNKVEVSNFWWSPNSKHAEEGPKVLVDIDCYLHHYSGGF